LFPEDLADLEELGLLPESDDDKVVVHGSPKDPDTKMLSGNEEGQESAVVPRNGRETVGRLPWLDALTDGSRLGTLRTAKGSHSDRSGTIRVEWEVMEWTEDSPPETPKSGKRKLGDRDSGTGIAAMEGVQQ